MSRSDVFGPRLRTARERSGLSLQTIAKETKVSVGLWEAMERNDFSRWPSGLFARSYIRAYAQMVGVDPEATVDEFCRWFPNGDRRVIRLIQAQAEIVGLTSTTLHDELPPEGNRRLGPSPVDTAPAPRFLDSLRNRRLVGILGDLVAVSAVSLAGARLLGVSLLATVGAVSLAYFSTCAVLLGRSLGIAAAEMLRQASPRPRLIRERSLPASVSIRN